TPAGRGSAAAVTASSPWCPVKVPWTGSNHTTGEIATYCIWYRRMLGSVTPTPTRSCPLAAQTTYQIAVADGAGPPVQHGAELLQAALRDRGLVIVEAPTGDRIERPQDDTVLVVVGVRSTPAIAALEQQEWLLYTNGEPGPSGYYVAMLPGGGVAGSGPDGSRGL